MVMLRRLLFLAFICLSFNVKKSMMEDEFRKLHELYAVPNLIDKLGIHAPKYKPFAYGDKECYPTAYYWSPPPGETTPSEPVFIKSNPRDLVDTLKTTCNISGKTGREGLFRVEYRGTFQAQTEDNFDGEDPEIYNKARNYSEYVGRPFLKQRNLDAYQNMLSRLVGIGGTNNDRGFKYRSRVTFTSLEDYFHMTYQFPVLRKKSSTHCECETWRFEKEGALSDYIERRQIRLQPKIENQPVNVELMFYTLCFVHPDDEHKNPKMEGFFCNCTKPTGEAKKRYTCDNVGRMTCLLEYEGEKCEDDYNECSNSYFCANGNCTNLKDGYRCDCHPGFSGKRCETSKNIPYVMSAVQTQIDCLRTSEICGRHGRCVKAKEGNVGVCNCTEDYTGQLCRIQKPFTPKIIRYALDLLHDFFVVNKAKGLTLVGAVCVIFLFTVGVLIYNNIRARR